MDKKINEKSITDKYPCKKCGCRMMYPNIAYGVVEGYKCANCGMVNHPVRDTLTIKTAAKKKRAELPVESISGIPPLVIMCGTDFVTCGYGSAPLLWLKPKTVKQSNALVIFDPDGSLLDYYSNPLYDNGYVIKVLTLSNASMSARYNPFAYIRSDSDIQKLVTALITGTKGTGKPGNFNFLSTETILMTALVSYLYSEAPKKERNFNTLIEMSRSFHKLLITSNKEDSLTKHLSRFDFILCFLCCLAI